MRHPFIACVALFATACVHLVEPTTPATPHATPHAKEGHAKQGDADVDLLHAIEADVAVSSAYRDQRSQVDAVSSAYRDQRSQVDALVDGDLETAWNSRTAELVGAWIEVRIPASAQVTSIAMTVGFTHVSGESDLFTGNHRITRVRVSRDGTVLGEHALDAESRALQTIAVSGAGGVYRIEVLEVRPGSRPTWRETCVSELRVMGRAGDAREGLRVPRTAVGALPPPRQPPPPPDRREIGRLHRQRVAAIERAWLALEELADGGREGSAPPESWSTDVAEIARARRTVLRQTAELVERIDPVEADALRAAALRRVTTDWPAWQHQPQLADDLATLAHAMDVVSAWLADDEARCRWARTLGRLHLARAASFTRAEREHAEIDDFEGGGSRESGRRIDARLRAADTLTDAELEWGRNTRGVAARLGRLTLPEHARAEPDLAAVRAQIDVARASCGWP